MKQTIAAALIATLGLAGAALADEPFGDWKRENGDAVRVYDASGKVFCEITSGEQTGFEMCHGMDPAGDSTWKGGDMKHPDMPGIMTFDGTIIVTGASLSIEGCTMLGAMCDAETWTRVAE